VTRRSGERHGYNLGLPPPPGDVVVLQALVAMWDAPLYEGEVLRNPWRRYHGGVLASALARHMGVPGARRLGRGAVRGSWSGTMDAGLRLVPRLRSLEQRGLVATWHDQKSERSRTVYQPTQAGRLWLAQQ
jgi:Transcriptional regulator PadR-like family